MPLHHPFTGQRLHGPLRSLDMKRVTYALHRASSPRFMVKYHHPRHERAAILSQLSTAQSQ